MGMFYLQAWIMARDYVWFLSDAQRFETALVPLWQISSGDTDYTDLLYLQDAYTETPSISAGYTLNPDQFIILLNPIKRWRSIHLHPYIPDRPSLKYLSHQFQ